MKRSLFVYLLVLVSSQAIAQDAGASFKKLTALQGTWSMESRKGVLYETWRQVNDSSLAGRSYRLLNNNDTLLIEEVQILKKGNDIFYIPIVQDQNNRQPVLFKLLKTDANSFSFDNPQHDYPQRIIYELPTNDAMHARIEGMDMGSYKNSDFYYKRIK